MPALVVECHRCQREFASGVTVSETGIRGYLADGAVRRCPHCGTVDPYFLSEHRLPRTSRRGPGNRFERVPPVRWRRVPTAGA